MGGALRLEYRGCDGNGGEIKMERQGGALF